MSEVSISRECSNCGKRKRFVKNKFSTFFGLLLTVFTLGWFLVFWIPLIVWQTFRPFRCVDCGRPKR